MPYPANGGVLTDDDIKNEIDAGRLVTGRAGAADPKLVSRIEACSFDMSVGSIYDNDVAVDSKIVPPGGIVALHTEEELNLPDDMYATAFAINAASSTGFLVLNPGHVDPGFRGPLTVFAVNIGSTPNRIAKGESVFTIVFERLPRPSSAGYAARHKLSSDRNDRQAQFMKKLAATKPVSLAGLMELELNERIDKRIGSTYATKSDLASATNTRDGAKWTSIGSIVVTALLAIASIVTSSNSTIKAERAAEEAKQALDEYKSQVSSTRLPVEKSQPLATPAALSPATSSTVTTQKK